MNIINQLAREQNSTAKLVDKIDQLLAEYADACATFTDAKHKLDRTDDSAIVANLISDVMQHDKTVHAIRGELLKISDKNKIYAMRIKSEMREIHELS
jgi:hypothetical protein